MSELPFRERRVSLGTGEMSPSELVQDYIECAERQLAVAQATLISARQRVASLQAATENWAEFAVMLDAPSRALTH